MSDGYRALTAEEAFWRRSNQMGVLNTDLGKQLEADRPRRSTLAPRTGTGIDQAPPPGADELYVVLEGTGRIRIGEESLTLAPLSALLIEAATVRQVFNDTDADALWLVVGTPAEAANTLEMTPEQVEQLYPDGMKALPPELGGGSRD